MGYSQYSHILPIFASGRAATRLLRRSVAAVRFTGSQFTAVHSSCHSSHTGTPAHCTLVPSWPAGSFTRTGSRFGSSVCVMYSVAAPPEQELSTGIAPHLRRNRVMRYLLPPAKLSAGLLPYNKKFYTPRRALFVKVESVHRCS